MPPPRMPSRMRVYPTEEGEDEQDAHDTVVDDEEVEQRDGQEGDSTELQLREWRALVQLLRSWRTPSSL